MLRARMVLVVALVACGPEKPAPVAPGAGAPSSTAPPSTASGSVFDAALADMIDACNPVIAAGAAEGPARVHERRIDLDRDGRDEAIFNVSCADVSQWKLLTEHDGQAVVLLERIATDTDFDVLLGPDGRALLVIQQDCCCVYGLEVHTLQGSALQQLFDWHSGCAPGCDGGSGYQATVDSDPGGNLRSITLPKGECGAQGSELVDLRSWTVVQP